MMNRVTPIRVTCNKKVKDYTVTNLNRLTGLGYSQVYRMLSASGSIELKECGSILESGQILIKFIDKFIPSVPLRQSEKRRMVQFNERWKKNLQGVLDQLSRKPVYLADEVNKILARRKSSCKCERIHLMWHLDRSGAEHMTPEEVADAIIEYKGTDWGDIRPLAHNASYTFRPDESTNDGNNKLTYEDVSNKIEFIYSLSGSSIQDDLLANITHDIQVLKEYIKLKDEDPETYEYEEVYQSYISRLKTLPPTKPTNKTKEEKATHSVVKDDGTAAETEVQHLVSSAASSSNPAEGVEEDAYEIARLKFNRGETLSEDDQLQILRKGICPSCGRNITERPEGVSRMGRSYNAFLSCASCRYTADGTIASPSIQNNWKSGLTPVGNRTEL